MLLMYEFFLNNTFNLCFLLFWSHISGTFAVEINSTFFLKWPMLVFFFFTFEIFRHFLSNIPGLQLSLHFDRHNDLHNVSALIDFDFSEGIDIIERCFDKESIWFCVFSGHMFDLLLQNACFLYEIIIKFSRKRRFVVWTSIDSWNLKDWSDLAIN